MDRSRGPCAGTPDHEREAQSRHGEQTTGSGPQSCLLSQSHAVLALRLEETQVRG